MINYYSKYNKHLLALDCIIFGFDKGEIKILLIKRDFEPAKGRWSLMGGFLDSEESLDESAQRILYGLTGLKKVFMEQLYTYGDIGRDPGERTISVAYYALLKIEDYDQDLVKKYSAQWHPISKIPDVIFDHNKMINRALKTLRRKARYRPIGFELLTEKFTLPQLQSLYEAIYQKKFDKRNFRKKIIVTDLLKKHEEKDMEGSKKGAYLYSFKRKKYNTLASKGFNFELYN